MPPRTSLESTRDRVLAAARAEFAQYGIAGARIDRLAKAAKTSKERVYAHFRSKEELYRVVTAAELTAAADATRLDPADLPAYAGRMHDYFAAHPECYRLMMWGRLELDAASTPPGDTVRAANDAKVEQLRDAQRSGLLDPSWDPVDVLALLDQIALAWVGQPGILPEDPEQRAAFLHERRAVAVAVAQRLFPAAVTARSSGSSSS
jgi:AcrR family transcriptional regulator